MVSSTRQAIACILVICCAAVFVRAQTVQPKEPTPLPLPAKLRLKVNPRRVSLLD